jgi:2',3'-cyclic-nucleotide 2'-phosphodiesterase (5'-nucleotidase family)
MLIKYRLSILTFIAAFLAACSTPYAITKSNREEYAINEKVGVDSTIVKAYLPYKTVLDQEMSKIIGNTEVALTKASTLPESVLGNFFADAVYNQVKKIDPSIDFVFPTTKGGLRNDIPKGPITVSGIFELMPFENQLVLFKLKGSDVLTILTYIASANGQPVAGLKMHINHNLPENIYINGKPFDVERTYNVVTSDYIASGGDDASGFGNPIARRDVGLLVRDALLKEVTEIAAAGKKINAKIDGRITKN